MALRTSHSLAVFALAAVLVGCSSEPAPPADSGPAPAVHYQMVPATTGGTGGTASSAAPATPAPASKGAANPASPGSD